MRSAKAKIFFILWLLVLTAGIVGVWYLLSEQNVKTSQYAQNQSNEIRQKINDVSGKINKVEVSFEEFSSRLSGQLDTVNAMQEKIESNNKHREDMMGVMMSIKSELDKFRQGYESKMSSIESELGSINAKMDNYSKNVNLGQVSVTKEATASVDVAAEVPSVASNATVTVSAGKK
jgi:chromosome segregation ATPase